MPTGKILSSPFSPAWWLPGAHGQTLWPYLFRKIPRIPLHAERLELPDGDFVDLCWGGGDKGPLVAIFHGLEGDISSPYAGAIMNHLYKLGWRGVFMHFRGCSGEPNRLPRSYHSGDTGDIGFLLQVLQERFPGTPVAAVGYSLGGNALLKYLGERAGSAPVRAAVAVSVPFQLRDSADRLSRGLSRIYQWRLVRSLRRKIQKKFRDRQAPFNLESLSSLKTFREFDEHITAPLHGFADAEDYYARSSSRQYLSAIRVPVLLIHSRNDPFMSEAALPRSDELSGSVTLELADKGGHVGFVGGIVPWKADYWLEKRITDFLEPYLL